MNKTEALARMDAIEAEQKALRAIIESPERLPGLWKPEADERYFRVDGYGDFTEWYWDTGHLDLQAWRMGNCFPSREIAEKASVLMARANKIIAAALQADPDAGVWGMQCRYSASYFNHGMGKQWGPIEYVESDFDDAIPAFVHTREQAEEMARILNVEGVR